MNDDFTAYFGRPLRVLVVDDHTDTLTMLETLLPSLGWEVVLAESSAAALERFDETLPDVVLSDLGMPDMDGYGLIGAIRERSPKRVAAIAVTGSSQREDIELALRAGFDHHVPKPISIRSLSAAVRKVLEDGGHGTRTA
jgi:two-component system CheB/CheR fusion protein